MLKEFKEFALRGNVVDLAIAVIIGAAFGKIVDSMVADIIMPIIGRITGGLDFSNMYVLLKGTVPEGTSLADAKKVGAVLAYGNFITLVVNFVIIAFVLFLAIKALNRLKSQKPAEAPAPPPPPADVLLLTEIRDLLARR
ncbi:large conductance mechanosensitive channel protein MscL [Labrys sp. La1]|uniref:large conductance mechanosensitive channel protein MscL n=1 Tax=Labrys sp. La1 TaxID=3404917 RepID=UPI003EB8C7F2